MNRLRQYPPGSDPEYTSIRIGDVTNGNYAEISNNNAIRYNGTSTVWKDMVWDIFGKRLYTTAGKVTYDYVENCIVFKPGGNIAIADDRIGGNQEINHEFKIGTVTFYPHIHWWQQVTSKTVLPVRFALDYRLQSNGSAKTTAWTSIEVSAGNSSDVYDFKAVPDGLYNQITCFPPITVTCGLSDTFQIRFARPDSEAIDVSVYFIDFHGEVDSDGSETELSKL